MVKKIIENCIDSYSMFRKTLNNKIKCSLYCTIYELPLFRKKKK